MSTKLLQLCLFIVAVVGLVPSAQARTWKSEKYNIEAQYVRYSDEEGGKVYVKQDSDGKLMYLKMQLLSESDQQYVLSLQSAARGVSNEAAMKGMTVVPASQRHALLIGINGYKSPVSPLKYCVKDMQDLSVALQNAGFTSQNIRLMVDSSPDNMKPTAQNILAQVEKIASSMKEGDFLFVAFSGHGVMLDDDQSYLCPIDVDRTQRSSFVSREKIFQLLDSSAASCKVFLCDACRDAFTIKGLDGRAMLKTRSISDSVNMNQHGFILMSSCSEKQQSMEHDRFGNGVFTHYLLEGLKGGAASNTTGNVSVMGLFNFAAEQTTIFTRGAQTPTFRNSGEMSNFIIAKLDRVRIQAEAPTIQIDDITGKISWGKIEIQPTKPIFVENITLPSVPVEITKTRVEIQLIQEAIKQLNDGSHPALQQSKVAVEQAKRTYYQIEKSFNELDQLRREAWSVLPKATQKTLFDKILQNPAITITSVKDLCPEDMSYIDFRNILEQGKSLAPVYVEFTKAKVGYARIQAEAASKLQVALNDLKRQLKQKEDTLPDLIAQFQTKALLIVMKDCTGYDTFEAEFPFESLVSRIPALEQYEFGWKEKELFYKAESVWKKNRPCIKIAIGIPGKRKVVTVNGVGFAFRWCPPGTFIMGSTKSEWNISEITWKSYDESQHEVTLSKGFWMLETEVTQRQWQAIMGNNPSNFKGDNLPVENVSWNDCQEFCKKFNSVSGLKIGLPTESQWEYACRAGTTTSYNFGTSLNGDKANCDGNYPCGTTTKGKYLDKTTPVGSYSANAWGLYDMHGNVREWCSDWYGDCLRGSVTDPTGASCGTSRVNRGGSWLNYARDCRSAYRDNNLPGYRNSRLGFRPVFVLFVP